MRFLLNKLKDFLIGSKYELIDHYTTGLIYIGSIDFMNNFYQNLYHENKSLELYFPINLQQSQMEIIMKIGF